MKATQYNRPKKRHADLYSLVNFTYKALYCKNLFQKPIKFQVDIKAHSLVSRTFKQMYFLFI